jgi:protein SCO1/2
MNWRVLLIAVAAWFAAAVVWADPPLDPSRLAAVAPPPFARAPMDLPFKDQHGRTVTLGDLASGRPLLLVPVQHACRNLCGLTLEALRSALSSAAIKPGAGFAIVAFGVDPRETPADAARSAARLGGVDAPGVTALVGDARSDAAVTDALGYRYTWVAATSQYAHMAAVAVLTPDGRLVRWLPGLGIRPAELQTALGEAKRGETPDLGDQIRLLCFHFDPSSGRYTLAVWRLTEWAAGGAVALLMAGVALALWRERRGGVGA